MDETDENISADDASMVECTSYVKVKPKKRSLVERELETSLTARVTSPAKNGDTCSTSRYGRARRLKTDPESIDLEKILKQMKSPTQDVTLVKMQSPVYKMHASNSPIKKEPKETPKKVVETDSSLQNQIENIYHENISLSRFGSDEKKNSPGSKFPKVYVRKDLIQKREKEDTVVLIKNMFSPVQSPYKSTNSHLNNILERSSEKYHLNTASKSHNGYGNTSVVKTLDFDISKKKKKENRDNKVVVSKSDLFDMEAKCEYQVGDLAWARMGTYPFWPCIVTREPSSGMFVKKKLFGRIERDIVHVTFFGDNGRRGWIVDTMLRRFLGQLEFEAMRERFSPTAKKRDPRLYAAYFISEKKMPQWTISVEEAEMLLREPKRLRIDLLNDMLMKSRMTKTTSKSHKSGKITRTASDVSLSESLYDTLFSEDDGMTEDPERSRSKTRKSLDVSEVVTACLDNMAAKTGITKIQRQSHMDRWLQKAKSKTPEKLQNKMTPQKKEKEVKVISSKKKKVSPIVPKLKPYRFRKSVNESRNLKSHHNEHDYSTKANNNNIAEIYIESVAGGCGIGVIAKVESLSEKGDSKEDSEVQTIGDVNDVDEALTSTTDKDIVIQDNVEIAPIVSADNTMDEIQVNLSVEEGVQMVSCLKPEQIEESNVGDEQKPIEGTTEEPSKEVENVMADSAKPIEAMKVDGDKDASVTSPSFEELVNENITFVSCEDKSGQPDSDNKNNNANVEYSENAKDEEINLENYVESMEVDVSDVSLSATKSKVDIETDIQQTNITESDKPMESDPDTSLQANFDKPEISSEVKLDDHSTKNDYDKSILRKRIRWSKEIKQDTVLNDNETQNYFNKPILHRKRSLRRAPIYLNNYEVAIKNSQRDSNAQDELLLNSTEDSRISHESETQIDQAHIELKHKKDDVIMDHHHKLDKQVTDKKCSSVYSDASEIEDKSIKKDQINSDEQELSLQRTQDRKQCLSLEIVSQKETSQIDLNKQDIALVDCHSKKDVDQPILTRYRSLRRHSKKNNDDSKAFDKCQIISNEVILQNAQENSNKECLSRECESPMEKSVIKLQEPEKHNNILDQKDLTKPILTRKRSLSLRGRSEKKKDDDVMNKSQIISNDEDLLLQSAQENISILNESLECGSEIKKAQIELQELKKQDPILDDYNYKTQQGSSQQIVTRKRSLRRSEKRKDDETVINSQIRTNNDDLLLQSAQGNINVGNESRECESLMEKAQIESQDPEMQDNILNDYKTQQDLDQPILTRKRSLRCSEKRKDDETVIESPIKTNDDDLLLQSAQGNINIGNEANECESQIDKAQIELQGPEKQDPILDDFKTQKDLIQPIVTRKRSLRRLEKKKDEYKSIKKSQIITNEDELLLQSSQEKTVVENGPHQSDNQMARNELDTLKKQDSDIDDCNNQKDVNRPISNQRLGRHSRVISHDEAFDPFNENQTDFSKQEKTFTSVEETSKEIKSRHTDSDMKESEIEEDSLLSTILTERKISDVENTNENVQIPAEIHPEIMPAPTSVNAIEITQPELEIRVQDPIDSLKEEEKIKGDSKDLHTEKKCVSPGLEEDMEYGHLDFTEKITVQASTKKELIKSKQMTVNDNSHMDVETEENEYDHLDFIFSSLSKQKQDVDIKSSSDVLVNYDSATNGLNSKEKVTENTQILIDPERNSEILKEKSLLNTVSINYSKQRELRVSVEKLPLSILPLCIINNSQDKLVQDKNKVSIGIDEEKLLRSEEKAEIVAEEITNGHCNNVSDMSVDEELDERLILQDNSFEEPNAKNNANKRTNDTNNEHLINETSLQVVNISTGSTASQDIKNVSGSLNGDQSKEKSEYENRSSSASMTHRKSIKTTSTAAVHPENDTKTVDEQEAISHDSTTSVKTPDVINKTTENIVPTINIDEFVTSVNRLPEPLKLNGFHIDECLDFSDGEFNAETSSINSEDSEPLSITKSKLISKNQTKALKALDDPEFVKYLELRQDQLMDEHPELSQDDIVEYLYKTWQYEENAKPDLVKNDDFEQSGLVKGLNQNLKPKKSRNNFRDSKKRNKKRDEDNVSINSDISDASVKRRLRTRINKSPATSIEDNEFGLNNEMTFEIKTELLDNVSVNTHVSSNSAKSPLHKPTEINTESKSVSPTISNHVSIKNASPDIERSNVKHSRVKDKTKSPKSKENTIKSYFKSTTLSGVSGAKTNTDVEIQIDTSKKIKEEYDPDTASINSEDSEVSQTKKKPRKYDKSSKSMTDPEFLKYVEFRQDPLIDENPQLSQDEIVAYLYKTWLYEESMKPDLKKTDDLEQASLVKGLEQAPSTPQHKRVKKKIKVEKDYSADEDVLPKDKPKRKISQPYYNEDFSDIEDEIELFEIFKPKKKLNMASSDGQVKTEGEKAIDEEVIEIDEVDEVELYFSQLTEPKPNVFKGLVREKVCEICERTGNLVKCKGCNCMFHVACVQKKKEVVEIPEAPSRGRKKKKKNVGRKPKNLEDSESHSDEKSQDVSEEMNASMEDDFESRTVNAEDFEAVLASKMQELQPIVHVNYDSYSSDDGLDWNSAPPGKCEIIDVKLKPKTVADHSNFKCINCKENSVPVCFVCKQAVSKTGVELRQRCQTAHCHNYYHLECLDHWPQTQFHAGEPSKSNKKINEHFEALMCPRHVCHTCVSDDPRGCKTRFSGDKLARCVRCPATYHSFTKCLPAGTQILTGSLIVCPRHYEHRPGKVPCHVNTGWCFICALGGSLICCEYCPTSFHAECLNIKPPEGGYMCEDCETGRLPLYGEMVWVKLGHYRWWPGIVLHPSEIPENIMAVKHSPGEFVVRFFGQYDHYWVNRGRVFPFQEGDSGKISSQKSKIDAAFTTAMEHAQRACEILKSAVPNEEESLDIASSLLPPHYVKLKVNKPCGSLCGRRVDLEESSLTQCECLPSGDDPCGPYSQCINRMLLTECGPSCRAGDRCNNRAFERRQYPRLAPYRTPSRGWGLKTREDIRAGQFVIEYVGELIDEEEFRRRMNRKHEIRDENFYFLTLDKERMIDAGPKGNLARFMNHCCEPNCETQKWTVLGDVRVGLFALYDIPANSELTFNYNLECAGIEKKRCMCGAKRCSGYIGAKPKQEESQPKKSKLPGKRTYKKRKNVEESPSTSKNKPKRPVGRPAKPRELTEIEKDLLIIKNATNGLSSDSEGSARLSSLDSERPKALKRKRVSFSTEDCSTKKARVDEKSIEVGD